METVTVEFTRSANTGLAIYGKGERAGFPKEMADHLIAGQFARAIPKGEQADLRAAAFKREAEREAERDRMRKQAKAPYGAPADKMLREGGSTTKG